MDQDLTDEQMDSLVAGMDTDINQTMPETETPETPQENPSEYTFNANGREVKVGDIDSLKKYASQGYNYSQLINEFKQKQDEFSRQQQEFNSKLGQYESIDKYAAENPDWWQHVNKSFEERAQSGKEVQQNINASDLESNPLITGLMDQLKDLSEFKNQIMSEKQQAQLKAEDEQLDNEIKSMREKYSDLDWSSQDENGKNLELQVLEHAQKNGINSFRVAFRDFYHENLIQKAEQRGKEVVSKEIQKNKMLGLLGESPTPFKHFEKEVDPKKMDYDQLEQAALEELGIAN